MRITTTIICLYLVVCCTGAAEFYYSDLCSQATYRQRRYHLMDEYGHRAAIVVFSADVRNRQSDIDFPYRQSSNLLYLTGHHYPGATLLLIPGGTTVGKRTVREILFVPQRDPKKEVWEGVKPGPAEAFEHLAPDTCLPATLLTTMLPAIISSIDTLVIPEFPTPKVSLPLTNQHISIREKIAPILSTYKADLTILTSCQPLRTMRMLKDTCELRLLQTAVEITNAGHVAMMKSSRSARYEYELHAVIEGEFRRLGAEAVGYPSIIGAGANACVLHYSANDKAIPPGSLVLADCGAEYRGYTADVTRTFPSGGRFTKAQRTLYELVLEAQDSALAACRPGESFVSPHRAASSVLGRGLVDLGIIKDHGQLRSYFPHGTSHYLGLDVHDVGNYGPLLPNTVITIEPGLYIPANSPCDSMWWNIGIRIEDDVLITEGDPINLSKSLPRSVDDIERLMNQ